MAAARSADTTSHPLHPPVDPPARDELAAPAAPEAPAAPVDVRSLEDVLAATALADRLLARRTYGGRVLHLVPCPNLTGSRHRPGEAVALCGAYIHYSETETRDSLFDSRPGCRRCVAVLGELTSTPDADGLRWSASTGGTVLHAWTPLSTELAAAHDRPPREPSLRLPPVKAACSKVFTPDPGAALSMRAKDARRSCPLPRCERCQVRLAARDGRLPAPTPDMLF